jgi:hypothetical protein
MPVTFNMNSGNLDNPWVRPIVRMPTVQRGRTGGIMPQRDTSEGKVVVPDVSRHTPFEHEITAEPTKITVTRVTYTKPAGLWHTTKGTLSHLPALPHWMRPSRKQR